MQVVKPPLDKTHLHHWEVQVFPPYAARVHEDAKVAGLLGAAKEVALAALEQLHEVPGVALGRDRSAVVPCGVPDEHGMALGDSFRGKHQHLFD